ncbi:MAG: DUF6384 family protein [Pseudomonadota bacterium]
MTSATSTDFAEPMTSKAVASDDAAFDDVMLAMDVVDTLRHRAALVARELDGDAREAALIDRLKTIYAAQGIDVPDHILQDGVKALEEKRFAYEPNKGGLQFALARFYVARDRWLRPVSAIVGIAAFISGVYQFGIAGPAARAERAETIAITETLPTSLKEERDAALSLAETDYARARIEAAYRAGADALEKGAAKDAQAAIDTLSALSSVLSAALTIRIVSRPGEASGFYRIPNDAPSVRNYYLVVEAVDAAGAPHALEIQSEEDQTRRRAEKWGVRTPKTVFDRVAADKADDQIVQDDVLGEKPKGALLPQYSFGDIGVGGAVLKW